MRDIGMHFSKRVARCRTECHSTTNESMFCPNPPGIQCDDDPQIHIHHIGTETVCILPPSIRHGIGWPISNDRKSKNIISHRV